MYRADIEMLNHAIEGVGDTFHKRNQLAEQKRKDVAEELLRKEMQKTTQKHYDAEETHYGAEQQHYQNMEGKQDDLLKHQQSQVALKGLHDAYRQLSENVAKGAMTPEQAKQAAKRIVDNIKNGTDAILQNSPFKSLMDDPNADIFTKPDAKMSGKLPAAAIQIAQHVQDLRDQATDLEDDDPDGADQLRTTAGILENHLKKNPPRPISIGSQTTVIPDPQNPFGKLGQTTTRQFGVPGADGTITPMSPAATAGKTPIGGTTLPTTMVKVKHPDGRTGMIPAENLPAAQKAGFQLVQ